MRNADLRMSASSVRGTVVGMVAVALLGLAPGGCESKAPSANADGAIFGPDGGVGPDALEDDAATSPGAACAADEGLQPLPAAAGCGPVAGDYTPREGASANDDWPACVSDGNAYVPFGPNISSLARVGAFEEIAVLLGFGTTKLPTPDEFLQARVLYTQEQGIESRVSRREDEHEPPLAMACRDLPAEEQLANAARCVGPALIRPIINAAFQDGIAGTEPAVAAARLEAALLWFFYISIYKEATTAATAAVDTDSMWAKYTGGEPRESMRGLSRYVRPRSQHAHDRTWDGLLAVRCWRDLDNPTGAAADLAMRDRARAQLDRALLYGMSRIVLQRADRLPCATAWETVKVLGNMLLREAQARDPAAAQVLATEVGRADAAAVDRAALTGALTSLFPCP